MVQASAMTQQRLIFTPIAPLWPVKTHSNPWILREFLLGGRFARPNAEHRLADRLKVRIKPCKIYQLTNQ
ncbi:MAG: hypothetical protein ACPGYL_09095, partial [Rhodospirillaceae bacterium]